MQRRIFLSSLMLGIFLLNTGTCWEKTPGVSVKISRNKVGLPYPVKGKLTPEMVSWISSEILYDYIVVVDLDPAVFDFEPEQDHEEGNADAITIDFITKILYPNTSSREVALADIIGMDTSPEKLRRDMFFVQGKTVSTHGSVNETTHMPVSVVRQDGIAIRGNFPKNNSVSTFETGQYVSTEKSFYIDRRPVTNRDYREFIRVSGRPVPKHWEKNGPQSGIKDDPVVNITYDDAAAYAAWVGKRLPTASEFERASLRNPSLRLSSPMNEWTSTEAQTPDRALVHYRFGGSPAAGDAADGNTGFRTALDAR